MFFTSALVHLYVAFTLLASPPAVDVGALTDAIDWAQTSAIPAPDRPSGTMALHDQQQVPIEFGIYDPAASFSRAPGFNLQHVFVAWEPFNADALARQLKDAEARHRDLMVTVEPWPTKARFSKGGNALLKDVAQGRYDRQIDRVCDVLSTARGRTLMRWGHEMEVPSDRYPWAARNPERYIAAFRHVVDRCRKVAPNVSFVWSPRGDGNLRNYYPGDRYVDLIGVSLWGLQKWDRKHGGRDRGFREVLWETYRNVVAFAKPVLISELGISGDSAYARTWLNEIRDTSVIAAKFPLLRAIVYFNDKEPHYWPDGFGSPDWRLDPNAVAALSTAKS